MATLQDSCYMFTSPPHAPKLKKTQIMSALNIPNQTTKNVVPFTNLQMGRVLKKKLDFGLKKPGSIIFNNILLPPPDNSMVVDKIQAILEAIADRIEMHKNIGEQRNNWNTLLLTSINGITLAAATMSGIVAAATTTTDLTALKLSCTMLYLSATCLLIIMNKIQPSQLVEEQRNATRLFQQLHNHIQTSLQINGGKVTNNDVVKEAMEKVLALDKAYPLPLLGAMIEKFPSSMGSAVWWPQQRQQSPKQQKQENDPMEWNGWNGELEKEMRQLVEVIRQKDEADYLRLGAKALKMNKILAVTGPVLTGMAAIGSAFGLVSTSSSWGPVIGIVGGALASVVNTIEHGGQVGMVFEMYRNNAGFFKFMEESIESNLMEPEVERRENGELLELKVALQLGRSLSDLRQLASSSSSNQTTQVIQEEFASKIF